MRKEIAVFQVSNQKLLEYMAGAFQDTVRQALINTANSVEFIRKGSDTVISFVQTIDDGKVFVDGHLGGCYKSGDPAAWVPGVWDYLLESLNVKSVIDVGCGYGHSTNYFSQHVPVVIGVEGSAEVAKESLARNHTLVHDYSDTAYIPDIVFDLTWSCEFVEHVEEKFMMNFIETFKRSKYVAMTYAYPGQGGHHHVNEQPESYWVNVMESNGFEIMSELTHKLREIAFEDGKKFNPKYADNHFAHRGLVFKNKSL